MKLDDTAKIVAIFSAVVTAVIGIAGYVGNQRLQALQSELSTLTGTEKSMGIEKMRYDTSSRLMADFSIPLARSFALQFGSEGQGGRKVFMPEALSGEFSASLQGWESRKGLMTGNACAAEGLKARQIVTLVLTNIGNADATDIVLTVRQKSSPHPDPRTGWQERSGQQPIGYDSLLAASAAWRKTDIPLDALRGTGSPEAARRPLQVVLASVSGTTSLFGSILVPVTVSWTDSVSKERQSLPVYAAQTSAIRASLLGAEIGTANSACR